MLFLLACASLLAACSDSIKFRDKTIPPPPPGAGDFLGYTDVQTKQTTCGNCHSGKQTLWLGTAHSHAWSDLIASGGDQPTCDACHSVSERGNFTSSDSAGWPGTHDAKYQDVQCESCHGPGLDHVLNPDVVANRPLASIAVDTNLDYGCAECHNGSHNPFAEEWKASGHANLMLSRNTNPSCVGCHDAKGVLAKWGITTNFKEASDPTAYMTVTCAVCHDPHNNANDPQTRWAIDVADTSQNLCMKCHQRRARPDPNSSYGPHSPQGPLLLGMAGWFPPNFQYQPGEIVGSHGSSRNPKLCVTCHMRDYEVTDASGKFVFRATGHSFDPIPCVDAQGIPTGDSTCAVTDRSFKACETCHLSETAARSAFIAADMRITNLSAEITTMLAQVPATEFKTGDNLITTGEGAKFNRDLANMEGSKVHNPFLLEALLIATIQQLQTDYGIQPSGSITLQAQLKR